MSSIFGRRRQQQVQSQIDKQIEAKTQLLRNQIDSMFDVFSNIITYLKSNNNIDESILLTLNDSAVSMIKLLGSACIDHIKNKEKNILIAGHSHFELKQKELLLKQGNNDVEIIKNWLNYAECALLGKKLNKLQISKITIDAGHKNLENGGLKSFMASYIGAEHNSNNIVNNVENNKEKYKEKNNKIIKNNKQRYQERQESINIQCPDQNKMYNITGNGNNLQYASSLYHPSSKYYNQRPRNEEKNNNMDIDINNNNNKKIKLQFMNAYVINKPPQDIKRNNKRLNIHYPYPCKIGKIFPDNKTFGVIYAYPNNDLKVKIDISNIETNPEKVCNLEEEYISALNLKGDNALGYPSITQQSWQ